MKATREQVFQALDSERAYQNAKGAANHGKQYLYYMEYYLRLLNTQITTFWGPTANEDSGALESLRKLTALGVAAMEEHGAPMRVATAAQVESNRPSDLVPTANVQATFSMTEIRTVLDIAFPNRPAVRDMVLNELEKYTCG
jgi:hypothetical protein